MPHIHVGASARRQLASRNQKKYGAVAPLLVHHLMLRLVLGKKKARLSCRPPKLMALHAAASTAAATAAAAAVVCMEVDYAYQLLLSAAAASCCCASFCCCGTMLL
jgi:hypothetical protein